MAPTELATFSGLKSFGKSTGRNVSVQSSLDAHAGEFRYKLTTQPTCRRSWFHPAEAKDNKGYLGMTRFFGTAILALTGGIHMVDKNIKARHAMPSVSLKDDLFARNGS